MSLYVCVRKERGGKGEAGGERVRLAEEGLMSEHEEEVGAAGT